MTEPIDLPPTRGAEGAESSLGAGPRSTASLEARGSPLASPAHQLRVLDGVDLSRHRHGGDFDSAVAEHLARPLRFDRLEVFQINVGKLCNMACRHCHVDAGPDRSDAVMDRDTIDDCLRAIDRLRPATVDITGGAPEVNPHFRYLVDECATRGLHVIDRCNLTVLLLPRNRDLPGWLAERGVEVVCSLPNPRRRGTDAQRGEGTFERSIEALRRLNQVRYGQGEPARCLTLVTNPVGALLTGDQCSMERDWKQTLERDHDVTFDRLIALINMPISRYLDWLEASGNLDRYLDLLVASFNPATVAGLMCRNTLSIGWDGMVYDCDFNQMLDLGSRSVLGTALHVSELRPEDLEQRRIVTGRHCFGCTAGAGSSCSGALDD